jgi:hypothetical protein
MSPVSPIHHPTCQRTRLIYSLHPSNVTASRSRTLRPKHRPGTGTCGRRGDLFSEQTSAGVWSTWGPPKRGQQPGLDPALTLAGGPAGGRQRAAGPRKSMPTYPEHDNKYECRPDPSCQSPVVSCGRAGTVLRASSSFVHAASSFVHGLVRGRCSRLGAWMGRPRARESRRWPPVEARPVMVSNVS